jgi:hypothetical protein
VQFVDMAHQPQNLLANRTRRVVHTAHLAKQMLWLKGD